MATCISVIIPTFKRPDLLRRCLEAIRNQSFSQQHFEVIVVADGPDPLSAQIVSEIKSGYENLQINYYELPQKKGPATARNFGWKQGKGELIAFTDDDCIPSENWLDNYWHAYQVIGKQLISFTGKVIVPIPETPTDYEKNVSHLATADFITANCACSRVALELVDGFDEEFPDAWREDSALEFELLKHQIPILKLQNAEVTHPVRKAPWGISIQDQKKSMFNALLFKKHPDFYRKKIASQPVWSYYLIIFLSLTAILFFAFDYQIKGFITLGIWFLVIAKFIYKRLKGSNISFSHSIEMIVTSLLIPYLSVYWTIRGAIRYKVFFL